MTPVIHYVADVPGPPRELVGYGEHPPRVRWQNGAKVAVQIVVNYEEGSEKSFAMGDQVNDGMYELPFAVDGQRDLAVESMYEYGSRVGIWRMFRIFDDAAIPVTFFGAAVALERNPEVAAKLVRRGDEVAGHGYRWSNHYEMTKDEEREAIKRAIASIEKTTGSRRPQPSGGSLLARRQRRALHPGDRLRQPRTFLRNRQGLSGPIAQRRRRYRTDDVGRIAPEDHREPRSLGRAGAIHRLRPEPG